MLNERIMIKLLVENFRVQFFLLDICIVVQVSISSVLFKHFFFSDAVAELVKFHEVISVPC